MRVFRYNPESQVLLGLDHVWLGPDEPRRVRVLSARPHGEMVLLTLEGVQGREAADALRGVEVFAPREALPPPDEDEYYHADLVGLNAFDPAGATLGTISDVIQYPSVDSLVLQGPEAVHEVPLLVPYVVEVDIAGGRIVIDHLADIEPVPKRR